MRLRLGIVCSMAKKRRSWEINRETVPRHLEKTSGDPRLCFPTDFLPVLSANDVSFLPDLISARYGWQRLGTTRRLSPAQVIARDEAARKIRKGDWAFEAVPCPCGSHKFRVVAMRDRFALPCPISACRKCGLLQANPRLTAEAYREFYGRHYRRIYMNWTPRVLFANERERGLRAIRWLEKNGFVLQAGQHVLEVGTGAGGILSVFAERGCHVSGCDLDQRFLSEGRARGLDLRLGATTTLTTTAPADLVILCHVLEHMTDLVDELARIRHLLGQNGALWVQVPGVDYEIGRYHHHGHLLYDFQDYTQNAHVYHFDPGSFFSILRRAGFRPVAWDDEITALLQTGPLASKSDYETDYPPQYASDPSLWQLERLRRFEWRRRHIAWLERPCRAAVARATWLAGGAWRRFRRFLRVR